MNRCWAPLGTAVVAALLKELRRHAGCGTVVRCVRYPSEELRSSLTPYPIGATALPPWILTCCTAPLHPGPRAPQRESRSVLSELLSRPAPSWQKGSVKALEKEKAAYEAAVEARSRAAPSGGSSNGVAVSA